MPKAGAAVYNSAMSTSPNQPPIPQDLLDALVCPACRQPVLLTAESKGLQCQQCHRIFPIRDGIPIMLLDEAVSDPA